MRILAIDFGTSRTGLAATDPLQLIASGIGTIETAKLLEYLKQYFQTEQVEKIVIGQALHRDGTPTYVEGEIQKLIAELQKLYPQIPIVRQDESLTSKRAGTILEQSGLRKKARRDKSLLDKISAVLILEDYMGWS